MEQLQYIFEHVDKNIGLCLDTCHAFSAGMCKFDTKESVDSLFDEMDECFGLERVKLIHLNDSKREYMSLVDKHQPLCFGHIWAEEENHGGLARLWELCKKHEIDIVSECATQQDQDVMEKLSFCCDMK